MGTSKCLPIKHIISYNILLAETWVLKVISLEKALGEKNKLKFYQVSSGYQCFEDIWILFELGKSSLVFKEKKKMMQRDTSGEVSMHVQGPSKKSKLLMKGFGELT